MEPTGDVTRQVFEKMQAGDRSAFEDFFDRNSARLLVYINYNLGERLRTKIEPGDVLQNVYLRLFREFESFCERAADRGVIRTLVRMADHEISEAYRYHFKAGKRAAWREVAAASLEGAHSMASPVSQRAILQEEYRRVVGLLRELSPVEQFVTVGIVVAGLTSEEVATRLGKSRGAVRMILSRVREKLRSRLDTDSAEP